MVYSASWAHVVAPRGLQQAKSSGRFARLPPHAGCAIGSTSRSVEGIVRALNVASARSQVDWGRAARAGHFVRAGLFCSSRSKGDSRLYCHSWQAARAAHMSAQPTLWIRSLVALLRALIPSVGQEVLAAVAASNPAHLTLGPYPFPTLNSTRHDHPHLSAHLTGSLIGLSCLF